MANFRYVTKNRLREEAERDRRRLFLWGAPAVCFAFFLNSVFGIVCLGIVLTFLNRTTIHLHGAEGEERALGIPTRFPGSLADLPDHFIPFNNLEVPGTGGHRKRELDIVVLARSGIFVVEVKHLKGEIRGSEADPTWAQGKQSRGGERYENSVRNPVRQVNGAAKALRMHLRSLGIEAWVEGIVVFTHPEGELRHTPGSTPVVELVELAPTILNHRPSRPLRDFTRVVEALKDLRIDSPEEKTPDSQHMKCFMRDFVTAQERVHGTLAVDLSKTRTRRRSPLRAIVASLKRPKTPTRPIAATVVPADPMPVSPYIGNVVEITTCERRWRRVVRR